MSETVTMNTAELFYENGHQAVRLPDEFRVPGDRVGIRKEGEAIILEPIKARSWPEHFFQMIRVDDVAFVRPAQGVTPAAPTVDHTS